MLATLAAELPRGGGWLYEVKLDGYRAIALRPRRRVRARVAQRQRPDGAVRARSRRRSRSAQDAERRARRRGLRARRRRGGRASRRCSRAPARLVYYAFDVLEADGEPLVDLPLEERRERLAELLDRRSATVLFSEGFADGGRCSQAAKQQGLEGVDGKRRTRRTARAGARATG